MGTRACSQLAPRSVDTRMWPRSPTTTSRSPAAAPSSSSDSIASGASTASSALASAGVEEPGPEDEGEPCRSEAMARRARRSGCRHRPRDGAWQRPEPPNERVGHAFGASRLVMIPRAAERPSISLTPPSRKTLAGTDACRHLLVGSHCAPCRLEPRLRPGRKRAARLPGNAAPGLSAGPPRAQRLPSRRRAAGVKSREVRPESQVHIGNSLSRPKAR